MSQVTLNQINNRTNSNVLLPSSGSVVQVVTRRVDNRVDYVSPANYVGVELSAMNITVSPTAVGNAIMVEWVVAFEAGSGNEIYVLVNGSPYFDFPQMGVSEVGDMRFNDGNYAWTMPNNDGNNDNTPQTMCINFPYLVQDTGDKTFSLWGNEGDFHLNRTFEQAGSGTNGREINVSYVTAYEICLG